MRSRHAPDGEDTRRQLLDRERSGTVPFFAVWMSRESVYVAPGDAQQRIIASWRAWFDKARDTWQVAPDRPIDDWYF